MQEQSDTRGSFFLNVNLVFFSQVVIYGLAFLFRVVLARGLGDEGLGTYALFFLSVLIASAIGNLGVGLGSIYYLNKGQYSLRELLSSSVFTIAIVGAFTSAIVVGYGLLVDDEAFVSGRAYWLYAPTVPVTVAYILLTALLHGSSRFLALASVGVTHGLAGLLIAGGLLYFDALDVFGAILAWTGSFVVADILALALVGVRNIDLSQVVRPRWDVLRNQVGYGMQGQLSNIAQLFNYRLDQYIVAAFVARASVGHYAVAVSVSESIWWISSAVAMVLLPRLTGLDKERADALTPVVSRNTVLVSIVAAAGIVAVSPVAIPLLFGDDFRPAVTPLILLAPGVVAISATRVLSSYLFSRGKVIYNTYTTVISMALTLLLDLALIPTLKVNGAAIASSIGYSAALITSIWFYRRLADISLRELFLPQRDDIGYYREMWRRLTSRWSGRRAEPLGAIDNKVD